MRYELLYLLCCLFVFSSSKRPNIVFILTDDQDKEMGSMNFMPRTLKILREGGATFDSAFTATPMCCPSRSSILTGMYTHNHNVHTNNENCSSPMWRRKYEPKTFGKYLHDSGYRTGYFGKYLNEYSGTHIPEGWDEWVALIQNSRYYNYTINYNGRKIRHGDDYAKDYFTDLITNDSISFMRNSNTFYSDSPMMIVLSMPAPHGHEDSAPQYQNMFQNITTHRTPSWNLAPNKDKQWLLQYTNKMTDTQQKFTDLLHRKRLQTLQSVDISVQRIHDALAEIGELENTYFLYTSDHGYHLGQYGLIKGKAMPYDFDTRIPFYMRGPAIPKGMLIKNIVLNIDIAPTLMDIAGLPIPDDVDGMSIMKLFKNYKGKNNGVGTIRRRHIWRDTFLIERGKVTLNKLISRDQADGRRITKGRRKLRRQRNKRLKVVCRRTRLCRSTEQHYVCRTDARTKVTYIGLCANVTVDKNAASTHDSDLSFGKCTCGETPTQERSKRSPDANSNTTEEVQLSINDTAVTEPLGEFNISSLVNATYLRQNISSLNSAEPLRCEILQNNTISCNVKRKEHLLSERSKIVEMINVYENELERLKMIRTGIDDLLKLSTNRLATVDEDQEQEGEESTVKCTCDMGVAKTSLGRGATSAHTIVERMRRRRRKRKNQRLLKCDGKKCKKKIGLIMKRRNDLRKNNCYKSGMECSIMTNSHWVTEPKWNLGKFCYCPNSSNNTYWCIRKINDFENILYCEFITGFISFYNLNKDPYQLYNAIQMVEFSERQKLSNTLEILKSCKGINCLIKN